MNPNQKKYSEIARELINKYHVFPEKSGNEIEAITQALLTAIEEQKEKDAKIADHQATICGSRIITREQREEEIKEYYPKYMKLSNENLIMLALAQLVKTDTVDGYCIWSAL